MTDPSSPEVFNAIRIPGGKTEFIDGAHLEAVQINGDTTLRFVVTKKFRDILKVSKIPPNLGLLVHVRDSVDDGRPVHKLRAYTRLELISLFGGPLAKRFESKDVDMDVLHRINYYVYGDHYNASEFSPKELKTLYTARHLLTSLPSDSRSGLLQMLDQIIALWDPRSQDPAHAATENEAHDQPLPIPTTQERDRELVAMLLSALSKDRLDRNAVLYQFIGDQLKAANHPKHYVQYSPLVLELATIIMIRCGARAGRLLRGPGLADPKNPRFNFFWPSERTCERQIKKRMPGNVIGFDYDAMRRVVTVLLDTEEEKGVRGFFCIQMDAMDVGSGALKFTSDGRLINGTDLGDLFELAFHDYPINDHEVKVQVEEMSKKWDLFAADAGKNGLQAEEVEQLVDFLRSCTSSVRTSAESIMAAHGKQHKAKHDADPTNPLLTEYYDPSTPVELLEGKVKPGRKQVSQAQACIKLKALIDLTATHLAELNSAWSDAPLATLLDQEISSAERIDLLESVVRATKALSVYAVKPAGKLVCFSITDCHNRASAVVARVFLPSEREDVIEPIFRFLSNKLEEMSGERNLTRSADGGNRPNLVFINGEPACITALLSKAKFTAMKPAQEYLLENEEACFAAISKIRRAGGIGINIPGPNGEAPLKIEPAGWNLDELETQLKQFIALTKPIPASAPQPTPNDSRVNPAIEVIAGFYNNEWVPFLALASLTPDARNKLKVSFRPPTDCATKYDEIILQQQRNPKLSRIPPAATAAARAAAHAAALAAARTTASAKPVQLDRESTIALGTQCRAMVMAAARFDVDENGAITGDGCLLQRLWISVFGEISVFDWAHVAKRFAIAVTEAPFGPSVPSPKAKKREAMKAAAARKGDSGTPGGAGGATRGGGQGGNEQDTSNEDGGGDKLDTGDDVDIDPSLHDGPSGGAAGADKVFEELVTVPRLFVETKKLPQRWYSRDRQNVPAALLLFKKEVVDAVRERHPFTAAIVEAFGGVCEAWDSSSMSMAERHERVNHFRRTLYPHIVHAMFRPSGPPEYVCGWHRVTIESMTNIAEALLLIDAEYVRRNGPCPRLNWVQRAVGTDLLENTFSNERATLDLNPRAQANATNHDEVQYAVGKTLYLTQVLAARRGQIHDPGFKHRAAGHIKPIGAQEDWGMAARLEKKGKRSRESETDAGADENMAEGESSVLEPVAKRPKKKEEFKAQVVGEKERRARQYHKGDKGGSNVMADGAE